MPANCDAHLAESLFQTRSKTLLKRTGKSPVLFIISSYILCRGYLLNRTPPSRNYILTACKIIVQLLD
ncbi:MAG: DUF6783 domain-containing protein [Blautia faecis]|uniref:DUF6783 domain-containing protein n=1 Tax=Ruminococcus sp. RTP21484sp1_RTP31023st1_H8_RTP31023_210422 TaxID=3141611 RepID=UPI0034A4E7CB